MVTDAKWDIVAELRQDLERVALAIHRQAKIEAFGEAAEKARKAAVVENFDNNHDWHVSDETRQWIGDELEALAKGE